MPFKKGEVSNPKGGRPKVATDDQITLITKLSSLGSHKTTIAHHCQIDLKTLNRWIERDERVAQAIERGRGLQHDYFVGVMNKLASNGSFSAAAFMLERKHNYRADGPTTDNRPQIVINLPAAATLGDYKPPKTIEAAKTIEAVEHDENSSDQ